MVYYITFLIVFIPPSTSAFILHSLSHLARVVASDPSITMSTTLDFGAHAQTVLSLQNLASLAKRFSSLQSLALPLAIAGFGLFTYLACNFIYNTHFHPYAKYPGPFLAKFTDLYAGYHAWKGDIHLDMWRCHQVYGDKVRYAPNRLNINTVTGLKSMANLTMQPSSY
jgi:hypothetical protein